jgi:hypothetical protein
MDGSRIMDTEDVNVFDFEASTLELKDKRLSRRRAEKK